MSEGRFTIATRVFLTAAQRDRLNALVHEHNIDVPELLTELLVSFLDHLPEEEKSLPAEPEPVTEAEQAIRARRAELRRLRARMAAGGSAAPQWMASYIADLERELARLEGR